MTFSLLQLSKSGLEALAAAQVPDALEYPAEPGSMPPAFVASRSLELAAAGHPAPWSTTFLIVNNKEARIVGGCGFKTVPNNGRVEVGYGVAPAAQGKGAATAALKLLVQSAFEAGATEVLAEVAPTNRASTRVVQKVGFLQVGARVDNENEYVVQWSKRNEAQPLAQPDPLRQAAQACLRGPVSSTVRALDRHASNLEDHIHSDRRGACMGEGEMGGLIAPSRTGVRSCT